MESRERIEQVRITMLVKRVTVGLVAASFLVLFSCRREKANKRLIEIAVRLQKQQANVNRIAESVQGIEARLNEIEASLGRNAPFPGNAEPAQGDRTHIVDFRGTPEYRQIAAALGTIQQRLSLTESALSETKGQLVKEREAERRGSPALRLNESWKAVSDPREMPERLDALIENVADHMGDPGRRQEFEADIEKIKSIYADNLTSQELRERLVSVLKQRLDSVQREGTRWLIGRQLRQLESPSGDELPGLLMQMREDCSMEALAELREKYHINPGAIRDAGLPDVVPIHSLENAREVIKLVPLTPGNLEPALPPR